MIFTTCLRRAQTFVIAAFIAVAIGCLALTSQAQPEAPQAEQEPVYVYLGGMPVVAVYNKLGPLPIAERARLVQERIDHILHSQKLSPEDFHIVMDNGNASLFYHDDYIMMVTAEDATLLKSTSRRLAEDYLRRLQTAVRLYVQDTRLDRMLISAVLSVLGLFGITLLATMLARWSDATVGLLLSFLGSRPVGKELAVSSLARDTIASVLRFIVQTLFFASFAALLFTYIYLVLNSFPWTKYYASQLLDKTVTPLLAGLRYATTLTPNIFIVMAIIYVAYVAIAFFRFAANEMAAGRLSLNGFDSDWAEPTYKLIRALVIFLAIVVAAPYLPGWGSPAFSQLGLFVGLLISLGSTGAVSHLVGGIILTYTRAFRVGDRVKISNQIGDIEGKSLLTTSIRTIKNELVTFHNSLVIGSEIVNYSAIARERGLILHTSVTIGYDAPWRQVHELLIAAARDCQQLEREPAPFVLQRSLSDFYIEYEINAYTRDASSMVQTYSFLHQNIQDKFNEAGLEIMSPHYSSLRDGNKMAIPDNYLSPAYSAPAFRLSHPGDKPHDNAAEKV